MTAVTILGRGDDWVQCSPLGELWGTATCLLTPGLRDKPFAKVFAFDGDNFPEIREALSIARERNIPIVSRLEFATEQYPVNDVVRTFRTSYFQTTMSYMLAYAIYKKFDILRLHGIGGRNRGDYECGKHYILFWLGVAYGRGMDVRIGHGSQSWLYTKHLDLITETPEERAGWHKCVLV